MKISTPLEGLQNELAEEVRQFEHLASCDVRHEMAFRDGYHWHTVFVDCKEKSAKSSERGASGAEGFWEQKRLNKRAAKLACYKALCALAGQTQPWGSLTGVRPTALLRTLLSRGQGNLFTEYYGVQPNKYELAKHIVEVQDDIMRKVEKDAICLYIGIPFCVSRCSYCSFPGRIAKKGEMERYVDALMQEMDAAAECIEANKSSIAAIYIGGGTPTSLPYPLLDKLLSRMQTCFGSVPEITLEAGRPDTLDADKLLSAKRHGVNRLCINPQTMSDETLRTIGRSHTAREVEDAILLARSLGFSHINMDIIAGLPGEGLNEFSHTLSIKRGSKLMMEQHAASDAKTVSDMVESARKCAEEMGMDPYYMYRQKYMAGNLENVGYAKKGDACLYNIAMMDEMRSVMALGVGSVGKLLYGDLIVRKPNPRDLYVYLERLPNILEQKHSFFSVDNGNSSDYNIQNDDDEAEETNMNPQGSHGRD